MDQFIKVRGARQHNLKNVDLDIPKNKFVVFTGVSGSGKSSLAFDTIYAEGQRRYVESLSTYARQFLGIMEKPDVDTIEGLSPAISIDQKTTSRNPRSTVGTVTEIYDYLRLMYAKIGHPHCPICGREIKGKTVDEIVDSIVAMVKEIAKTKKIVRFLLMSPIVNDKKGEFSNLFDNLKAKGYRQVRVDGIVKNLSEDFVLIKTNKHTIEAIIDKISFTSKDIKDHLFLDNLRSRISDSTEQALTLSEGMVSLSEILDKSFDMPDIPKEFSDHLFSEKFSCPVDNISLPEIEPRTFSFNSPHGACPQCSGIGKILKVDENLVLSKELTITEGAMLPFANTFENDTWYARLILAVCSYHGINARIPLNNLKGSEIDILLKGTGNLEYRVEGKNRFGRETAIYEIYRGVISELERRHKETDSDWVRAEIEKYMREQVCPACAGTRLKKEATSITIEGLAISDICNFPISKLYSFIEELLPKNKLSQREQNISRLIIKEILERLKFLLSVGLEYLTLGRNAGSLSGGEAQRIRLASQIGSGLTGVLYVLDEPTIGLHQRDNQRLIETLKKLRDLGNTVLVVEHDAQTIKDSDWIADFGPGAGKEGGRVVATGSAKEIIENPDSITGKYLSGKRKIDLSGIFNAKLQDLSNYSGLKDCPKGFLKVLGCSQYNLKNLNVTFPLGKFVVITGVSGSGKSTLLVDTLFPALENELNPRFRGNAGAHERMEGIENVSKAILIDQSPIGRTPRSNPATYTKLFDPIRDVFALTKDSKVAGYKKGRFSFNVKGGRCDACEGQGQIKIEMQFMSDIWVTCEICKGSRYNASTLEILYKGKNIAEILKLNVKEAIEFFHTNPKILSKLETLSDVGLDYMELGQPATTLSGGEAQRIKLATELSKKESGKNVYILDEPTTGLHFADVDKLLRVLKLLVSRGNSVFVIEHNTDVIKNADWIIDLGPEGGEKGGEVVFEGTYENIKKSRKSYTGKYL